MRHLGFLNGKRTAPESAAASQDRTPLLLPRDEHGRGRGRAKDRLCCAVPRCTILLRYTAPHRTVPHRAMLYCTILHYTTLYRTMLHYTTLYYTTLRYTTLHYYTVLHYTLLHCAILHCATLHCAAPRRTLPRCRATPRRMVARHPVLLCCAVLTAPPTAVEQSFLGGEPRGRVAGVQAQRSRGVCGPPGG